MIPLTWRIGIAAGAVAGLIALGWQVNRWRGQAAKVDGLEQSVAQLEKDLEAAKNAKSETVVRSYQLELAGIGNLPPPVIRLCGFPAPVYSAEPAAGASGAGDASGSVQPVPAGADLGPAVNELMRRADEQAARLRAVLELGR